MKAGRIIALSLVICVSFNMMGCTFDSVKEGASVSAEKAKEGLTSAATTAAEEVVNAATTAKNAVSQWYSNLDFSKFEEGWNYTVDFMSGQYAAVMSSEYVSKVETAIANLETDINASVTSARGTAQEAGFLAEKWVTDTFNINAAANESPYSAETPGSNQFASADVVTNYEEEASLKYYKTASASVEAQAKAVIKAYKEYCSKTDKEVTLKEYLNERGYSSDEQDVLMSSIYEGQTRIIPSDQLAEATEYLQGKIDKLSSIEGDAASARTKAYQETLNNLKDRLHAPDGTESKPLTREEAQAITELAQDGKFRPEEFGIELTSIISPKYIVKQAVSTGFTTAALNTVFTIGPDIYSILKEAAETGNINENDFKETGVEGVIAATEGFVEGSASRMVTTLCQSGALGTALKDANPSVVATLTILAIEGAIHGYEVAVGKMTLEEYGNMMADRIMVSLLAIPTSALLLAILPASKLFVVAGCLAGGMLACIGYTIAKEAVMDMVDAGGFEAIVPVEAIDAWSVAKDKIASLNLKNSLSNYKDSILTTMNDGYIKVSTKITE